MAPRSRSGRGKGRKPRKPPYRKVPKRRRELTPQQEQFAARLATAPSRLQAAIAAGYSPNTAISGSWWRRVQEKIRPVTLAHLAKAGLTLPVAAKKHCEKLHAMETKFFQHKGNVVETREVAAHGIQLQAVEDYYRVLGLFGKVAGDVAEAGELGNRVNITINYPPASAQARRGPLTIRVPKPDGKGDGRG